LECAPDKPTNHEKDYEYDCQCERRIVAACPAGRVHVTQDAPPEKWSAAPKKSETTRRGAQPMVRPHRLWLLNANIKRTFLFPANFHPSGGWHTKAKIGLVSRRLYAER
jgi:hypothetical protein